MKHDEMIGKVQAVAQLPDRGSAERVTRAVLTTLGERLPGGLATHVAAQLPHDPADWLRHTPGSDAGEGRPRGSGERFALTAFAGRVAARAGMDEETALRDTGAVLEVLDAALTPETTDKMAAVLPRDIGRLLPAGRAREG